ncbi:hypothetical protein [Oceanidesulfovibrio marinus]|uniref:Uncharacterized protein n=1 Tax=Oceanidesulfovibrio marinus TaxID=370038 RepID=A0ABX6NKL7_9BACT|nr:hypothetical protein [Oceanidesulfovibrio marinus]QJT10242.1 hypothetical protein E8L03_15470 [Oceanidesulfovibrio marinus]
MAEDPKQLEEVLDSSLEKSMQAEEYEAYGRKMKRPGVDVLLKARNELAGEERVRRQGNILARAGNVAVRRGE